MPGGQPDHDERQFLHQYDAGLRIGFPDVAELLALGRAHEGPIGISAEADEAKCHEQAEVEYEAREQACSQSALYRSLHMGSHLILLRELQAALAPATRLCVSSLREPAERTMERDCRRSIHLTGFSAPHTASSTARLHPPQYWSVVA